LVVGYELKIDFDLESREYNGRWYTDVKAWRIELVSNNISNNTNNKQPVKYENKITPTFLDEDNVLP